MDDQGIVELYWKRSERAISETDAKYGGYCYHIAYNILSNREDAEESVSDTYLAAWHKMPPQRLPGRAFSGNRIGIRPLFEQSLYPDKICFPSYLE